MTTDPTPGTHTAGRIDFADTGGVTSALNWTARGLTPERAWRALCRTYASEAAGHQHDYVKLLVNGEFVRDHESWPTRETDTEGFSAWLERQQSISARDDVFVFARTVQEHDRDLFRTLVELVAPHLHALGLAPGHVEAEVFYGAYRNTPGGIHREGCTNLHLVLGGRKSMHFWRGTDWIPAGTALREDIEPEAGHPEEYLPELGLAEALPHGHSLTATGGGGYFWRSGIWHVGETHEPSIALNIASYTKTLDVEAKLLTPWAERVHGDVPPEWLRQYREHTSFTGDDAALLARLTALGMRPAPAGPGGGSPSKVRMVSTAPVVWSARPTGGLTVATLGHSAVFADTPSLRAWLDRALASPGAVGAVPEDCRGLARWLCAQQILEPLETT
ncbi:hypothetical protein [Streptomyces paradoxus]|uniref:hypothetical protein n=1 Tax=Streptomyces paradoxus TaxID=66375 RepID=UPI00381F0607